MLCIRLYQVGILGIGLIIMGSGGPGFSNRFLSV